MGLAGVPVDVALKDDSPGRSVAGVLTPVPKRRSFVSMDLKSEAPGEDGRDEKGDNTADDNVGVSTRDPSKVSGVDVLAPVVVELSTTL